MSCFILVMVLMLCFVSHVWDCNRLIVKEGPVAVFFVGLFHVRRGLFT